MYVDPLFVTEVRMRAPLWPIIAIAFGVGIVAAAMTFAFNQYG